MRRVVLQIIFVTYVVTAFAQFDYLTAFNQLSSYETGDLEKRDLSTQITKGLSCDLQYQDFAVDSVLGRYLKYESSPDGVLNIYTWCYVWKDATAQYGGVVKYNDRIIPLAYNDLPIDKGEQYFQDNWCGGICYDIIPVKRKSETIYTLLVWDGNDGVTSKKIIDVLSFDRKGRAIFGLSVFGDTKTREQRIIIEYPMSNSLLLEYDEDMEAIVSNVLYVNDDRFAGVSEYYSATDVFNVYRFEGEKWVLYPNQDLRLNKNESDKLQNKTGSVSSGL